MKNKDNSILAFVFYRLFRCSKAVQFVVDEFPVFSALFPGTLSPPKADITALDYHTVLLMSDYNPKSFDGRYFGLMDKSTIIGVVKPLWTW
jgi:hypothetical protein